MTGRERVDTPPADTTPRNDAQTYWAAVAAHDWQTARTIALTVVHRLRHEADELEERGQWLAPSALRLEARAIERGELAPFPKVHTHPDR